MEISDAGISVRPRAQQGGVAIVEVLNSRTGRFFSIFVSRTVVKEVSINFTVWWSLSSTIFVIVILYLVG